MRLISSSSVVDCAEQVMRGGHCSLCGAQQDLRRAEAARARAHRYKRPSERIHRGLQAGIEGLSLYFGSVRIGAYDQAARAAGRCDPARHRSSIGSNSVAHEAPGMSTLWLPLPKAFGDSHPCSVVVA
jgi:hypothetical protein